ncbi:putative inactive leucine-rich repeat receptor-like protein kinase [Cocos nucifera]|nr:putative inactive leucine-rich repeat receptor-like protein kinase [Cocos nucifera]
MEISLRSNRLEGEIPAPAVAVAVAALPALHVMDFSHNGLWGTLPALPGAAFDHPSLEQLTLACDRLESVQGPWDGGLGSQLIALDLEHNCLGGLLPTFLGSMPRLSALSLEDNWFTGMIPTQYAVRAGGAVPFARLNLSENYLFGPIPSPIGGLMEGSAMVSLADNCLFRCPPEFFFSEGGRRKPPTTCREFNPVIP